MPRSSACPNLGQYHRLASGQLEDGERDAVLEHLENCDSCAAQLQALPEQVTLAGLVRNAETIEDQTAEKNIAQLVERLSRLRPQSVPVGNSQDAATVPPAPATFAFPCPACGQALKIKTELAGKKVRCPQCRQAVQAPANASIREDATVMHTPEAAPDKSHYDFLAPAQAADELGRLGSYRVLEVLGAGGMGVVFRAEDPHLERQVALKAMLPALAASASAKERFTREARAAAKVKHDHIVTIHQVGEDRGVPFLAMEFLEGEPLDARLEREGKLPVAEVLRIGRETALGLAAAHKRGLIHRDIKPANIWLEASDERGMTNDERQTEVGRSSYIVPRSSFHRVKILDFGLARATSEESKLTQQGAIVGTPAYMAPEQAQGKTIDQRCDLFSLGCVLYRMATGVTPFKGTDMVSTLMSVATETPTPPVLLNLDLPTELSDFIMRLLAKDPAERPPSAQEVAETLELIARSSVAGSPESATGGTEGLLSLAKTGDLRSIPVARSGDRTTASGDRATARRPAWRIAAGVAACLALAAMVVLWNAGVFRLKTSEGTIVVEGLPPGAEIHVDGEKARLKVDPKGKWIEIQAAPGERKLLIKAEGFSATTQDVILGVGERKPLRIRLEPLAVAKIVERSPSYVVGDGWRMEGAELVQAKPAQNIMLFGDPTWTDYDIAVETKTIPGTKKDQGGNLFFRARDGKNYLTFSLGGYFGTLNEIYHLENGKWGRDVGLLKMPFETDRWYKVQIQLRGPRVRCWLDGQQLFDFKDERFPSGGIGLGTVNSAVRWKNLRVLAPDGKVLWEGFPHLPPSKSEPAGRAVAALDALRREQIPPEALALAGDGDPKKAPASLVAVLGETQPFHTQQVCLAFSPDGRWLASGSADHSLFLRDPDTGKVRRVLDGHTKAVTSVAFSKDSMTLVSAGKDGSIRFWPIDKAGAPKSIDPKLGEITALTASADGRFLAAGGAGGTLHLWKWGQWEAPLIVADKGAKVTALAFSPDGEWLSFSADDKSADRSIMLVKTSDGKVVHSWPAHKGAINSLAFSKEGKLLASTGGKLVRVWELASRKVVFENPNWTDCFAATFHPDGQKIFASLGGRGHLFDLASKKAIRDILDWRGHISAAAFRPDGKRLAIGTGLGVVEVRDADTWEPRVAPGGPSHHVSALAVSPDGSLLAGGEDYALRRWDLARPGDNKIVHQFDRSINDIVFTHDGKKFATTASFTHFDVAQRGVIWDAATDKQLVSVQPRPRLVSTVFSPDGKLLVGSDYGTGCVHFWDVTSGREVHRSAKIGACVDRPAFSADGKLLATATADTLKIWDVAGGNEVRSWQDKSMCALALRGDGRLLAAGHHNGTISLWDLTATPPQKRVLTGHSARIHVLRFTPDGMTLVSSSHDGTIRVWEPARERALQELIPLGKANERLLFDLDATGRYVFAAGHGPLIYVLRLKSNAYPSPRYTNSLGMEFALVPKGKAWLGGGGGKPGDKDVEFKDDFYLGVYEVTQEEWEKVMAKNNSFFSRSRAKDLVKDISDADLKRFPVDTVNWDDVHLFLKELNLRDQEGGWVYRLPTQDEWEYACRGGPSSDKADSAFDFYLDRPSTQLLPDQANFGDKLKRTSKVGSYKPNRLGLYDMHGNVLEWCTDELPPDPKDPKAIPQRVLRGGCWSLVSSFCKAAQPVKSGGWFRHNDRGLRVARVRVGTSDPDRRAAEWVLSIGGQVKIEASGLERELQRGEPWPDKCKLVGVNLVDGVDLKSIDAAGAANFRGCRNIKELRLFGPQWRDSELGYFQECKDLRMLNLNATTDVSNAGLAVFKDCKELRHLGLHGCRRVNNVGLAHFKDCQKLEALSLSYTQLGDAGLSSFKNCKYLTLIDISHTNVTDVGMAHLKAQGARWKHFALSDTKVSDASLAHLKDNTELTQVYIGDTSVTEDGLRHLAKSKNLTHLWVDGTAIGDAAVVHLTKIPSLRVLNIKRTRFTPESVKKVAAALPRCMIMWDGGVIEPSHYTNSLGMEFALVPRGKAWLGGGGGKVGTKEVEIKDDFYLGVYEVTQEEWQKLMGKSPSHFSRTGVGKDAVKDISDAELKRFPLEMVSWEDAQLFLARLNELDQQVGWKYRLPTEAEWEYACRGGPADRLDSGFDFYLAKPSNELTTAQANFDNLLKRTCKVGSYQPNRLGLFDMHGNVWEWCDDSAKAPDGSMGRVRRGGGWLHEAASCRAVFRGGAYPPTARNINHGLRVARVRVAQPEAGFVQLFNGKDLTGWKLHPKQADAMWKVDADGNLVGSGAVSHLFSERGDYTDFHLRAVCKVSKGGDSGIFFRSEFGVNRPRFGNAWVEPQGYEAGINHGHSAFNTGTLFGPDQNNVALKSASADLIKADQWFTMEVMARGNQIQVRVDGRTVVDYVDVARLYSSGHFALQVGPGKPTVHFKSVEVKRLSTFTNSLGMEFALIPRGKSWLGGADGKPGHKEVEFKEDFYLGVYEVTQEEWRQVMGNNPSFHARTGGGAALVKDISDTELNRFPVESTSKAEALQFIAALNAKVHESGWVYRLPTSSEWEYACRGGPQSRPELSAFSYYYDQPSNDLDPKRANVLATGLKRTCKVGSYAANALGLHDMHGNVSEWCQEGEYLRMGGSFLISPGGFKANFRFAARPTQAGGIGLRVARVRAGNPSHYTNALGMEFALVPRGKAWLGGGGGKPGTKEVEFKEDFYLGVYEVTQEEWLKLMEVNPSNFSRQGGGKNAVKDVADADLKRFPVETLSWELIQTFLTRLNDRDRQSGWLYRLPTEAEWEYACRGGPGSPDDAAFHFYFDKGVNVVQPDQVNFREAKLNRPCTVGRYPPNKLGLFDMHGNVWEWCDGVDKPSARPVTDPKAPRALRGGSWKDDGLSCRITHRVFGNYTFRLGNDGLRVARVRAGTPSTTPESRAARDYDDLATGRWHRVLATDEDFKRLQLGGAFRLTDGLPTSKVEYAAGVLDIAGAHTILRTPFTGKDMIVRARIKKLIKSGTAGLRIPGGVESYHLQIVDNNRVDLGQAGKGVFRRHGTFKREVGDEYIELALAAVGDRIIGYLDGKKILETRDAARVASGAHIQVWKSRAMFKDIEVMILDRPDNYTNSLGMEFAFVPKGKAWLGGGDGKPGTKEVEFKDDFYLGVYEVTQEQWQKVMDKNPSYFSRAGRGKDAVKDIADADLKRFPVEHVSWDDAQAFLDALNRRDKQDGWMYRLPTEAEWEFACRGGSMAPKEASAFDFYFLTPTNQLQAELANFAGNGLKRSCKVGSYLPNALGLHDMHGNVWEWCADEQRDPRNELHRVFRGGAWSADAASGNCRAIGRSAGPPVGRAEDRGLRLARVRIKK